MCERTATNHAGGRWDKANSLDDVKGLQQRRRDVLVDTLQVGLFGKHGFDGNDGGVLLLRMKLDVRWKARASRRLRAVLGQRVLDRLSELLNGLDRPIVDFAQDLFDGDHFERRDVIVQKSKPKMQQNGKNKNQK